MVGEIDNSTVVKAYARWAPVYDLVFGKVFERGRKASIAAAEHRHRHFAVGLCAQQSRRRRGLFGGDAAQGA